MPFTIRQFAKQAAAASWKDGLRKLVFDSKGGLTQGVTGLAGALLGGGTGAVVDMFDGGEDSPWDAALVGAGLGGLAGYSGMANRFLNSKLKPFLPQKNTLSTGDMLPEGYRELSTGDMLPEGYREKAVEAARAYRSKPDTGEHEFMQDLSDEAIDRKVPVMPDDGLLPDFAAAGYAPIDDFIMYKPDAVLTDGEIRPDNQEISHELVHGQQREGLLRKLRTAQGTKGPSAGSRKIRKAVELPTRQGITGKGRPATLDWTNYLGSPHEEEAYLAPLKREYFRQTGKVIRTPQEARQFLRDAASGRIDVDKGKGKSPLLLLLRRILSNPPRTPGADEEYLDHLSRTLPGLVKNTNIQQAAKQAAELSIK